MAKVLFSGCRSGKFPLEYALSNPEDEITVHAYDAYQARKIREDVGFSAPNVSVVCSAWLSDAGDEVAAAEKAGSVYERAFYYSTSKLISAEFELDILQDIYRHLAEGAELRAEGVEPTVLAKVFPKTRGETATKRKSAWSVGVKKGALKRPRAFAAAFSASVPGGPKLEMLSLPGCFCHRRADEGGLALAEVVCREISGSTIAGNPAPVLDIGCGSGMVGLLTADAFKAASVMDVYPELTLLDSHTRAVAAAGHNSAALAIPADCVLSDDGLSVDYPLRGKFGTALANPPYYGEGRIADLFARIAAESLSPKGVCWMVAKSPAIIRDACSMFFSSIEEFKRRGYTVLRASSLKRS